MMCNGSGDYILPPPEGQSLALGFLGFVAGRWSRKTPPEQLFLCTGVSTIAVYLVGTAGVLDIFRTMHQKGEVVPRSTVCLVKADAALATAGLGFFIAEIFLNLSGAPFICHHWVKKTVGYPLKLAAFAMDYGQFLLLCFCAERIKAIKDPIRYLHSDKQRRQRIIVVGSIVAAGLIALPNVDLRLGCPRQLSSNVPFRNKPNSSSQSNISGSPSPPWPRPALPAPYWSQEWSRCPLAVSAGVRLHNAVLLAVTLGTVLLSLRLFRLLRRRRKRRKKRAKKAWGTNKTTGGSNQINIAMKRQPKAAGMSKSIQLSSDKEPEPRTAGSKTRAELSAKRSSLSQRRERQADRAERDSRAGAIVVLAQSWLSGAVGLTVAAIYVLQQARYVSDCVALAWVRLKLAVGMASYYVLTAACVGQCGLTPLLTLISSRSYRRAYAQWRWHARLAPRHRFLKALALWYMAGPVIGLVLRMALWFALG